MLRRTRADQVVPVYQKFAAEYQTARDARKASVATITSMLKPLGLQWRAEQFYQTIHYLSDNYERRNLVRSDELQEIPGVGPYSEAMLKSLLLGVKLPAIDSNVVRIFYRLAGRTFMADYRRRSELIETARDFVKSKNPGSVNLALIDLGALVCRPGKPDCRVCPLAEGCRTAREDKR
jgi:A/G-specific adenine glycosylase